MEKIMNMPDDINQFRKLQRALLLARRLAVTTNQHRHWNDAIDRLLIEGFPFMRQLTIGIYWPYKGEYDPRFVMREFRKGGAIAALPIVIQKAAPLQFRKWWPGAPVIKGVFGLPNPDGTAVLQPDALLIPPIAFDLEGYRLGYGGGYFDRTLAGLTPQPLKIGVAFELSRMESIFPQPHDIPMDFVVTETAIHHVSPGGLVKLQDPGKATEIAEQLMKARKSNPGCGFTQSESSDTFGERATVREYASPPCFAHELDPDYWGQREKHE
jgi:5,10-methenyltetrahydrofolate synthetase